MLTDADIHGKELFALFVADVITITFSTSRIALRIARSALICVYPRFSAFRFVNRCGITIMPMLRVA